MPSDHIFDTCAKRAAHRPRSCCSPMRPMPRCCATGRDGSTDLMPAGRQWSDMIRKWSIRHMSLGLTSSRPSGVRLPSNPQRSSPVRSRRGWISCKAISTWSASLPLCTTPGAECRSCDFTRHLLAAGCVGRLGFALRIGFLALRSTPVTIRLTRELAILTGNQKDDQAMTNWLIGGWTRVRRLSSTSVADRSSARPAACRSPFCPKQNIAGWTSAGRPPASPIP